MADCGNGGNGCEVCKPTIGAIFAQLFNEPVHAPVHRTLQDTNDRFLANIQRGGSYSVVPRIPGGEITPQKLRHMVRARPKLSQGPGPSSREALLCSAT